MGGEDEAFDRKRKRREREIDRIGSIVKNRIKFLTGLNACSVNQNR
jgi:hypothetical protein